WIATIKCPCGSVRARRWLRGCGGWSRSRWHESCTHIQLFGQLRLPRNRRSADGTLVTKVDCPSSTAFRHSSRRRESDAGSHGPRPELRRPLSGSFCHHANGLSCDSDPAAGQTRGGGVMDQALITLGVIAVSVAVPVLWATLGELVSEQAGMINPGIEGVMLLAALATTVAYRISESTLVALGAAAVVGIMCGLLFGFLLVTRGLNQIITGILFNVFAFGSTTTVFIAQRDLARARVPVLEPIEVPLLERLPIVGPVLFRGNVSVYVSILAVIVVWVLMRHTWVGLSIRAAGQHPRAVESA